MPKNKFQDVVLTAIMATIMVYGMVVYNVALATGGLTAESFLLALHELPIMVPIAFVLDFFCRRENCKETGVYGHAADGSTAVHHLCHFYLHLLYHVPADELGRDDSV